ncbi:hypothetical protein DL764_001437 [Monosporascus ibericus]|uniref:Stress-response A/B barrel domain-containing protein n=1 Tax=Monosporascus ibericus TaxID=155417 RepID=A0A4Q4TPF2_9PEZI|nr:hypothetical protein DL764_001437 [Monosporascus ibericus]
MTSGQITRITLFKILNEEEKQKLLDMYKQMPTKAVKDGKPYILNVKAGPAVENQDQGYTVGVVSTFASHDDMVYYDNECTAHAELKSFAKTVHRGAMMVFFESVV